MGRTGSHSSRFTSMQSLWFLGSKQMLEVMLHTDFLVAAHRRKHVHEVANEELSHFAMDANKEPVESSWFLPHASCSTARLI